MHPRYEHEKEYIVEVYGRIEDDTLLKLGSGSIDILGSRVQPATVKRLSSGTFSIVLKEGKNRQIRRMVEVVGHMVKKLKRIRIENIHLGNLEEGEYISLTPSEQAELLERTIFANSKSLG
jgi:23S rRNA pseudouridine2605 synthase